MHIPTSLAITLSLLLKRQAFEAYDSCAQDCFNEYLSVASQCDETVTSQAIACVCGNTFYGDVSAACIFSECGATILNSTAQKHEYNCNLNGSPPALNAQQSGNPDGGDSGDNALSSILSSYSSVAGTFTGNIPAATSFSFPTGTTTSPTTRTATEGGITAPAATKSAAQASAAQTSSAPATSSSASSSSGGSNTLSTGALVGSIVGSITGAIGSFAGVYFAWKTYKIKKEEKQEKAAAEAQAQQHVAED